ncbi:MAG: ribonuclease E/G [Acidobacteriota bacterium]
MARKEIITNYNEDETRVAILEDGQLTEVFLERARASGVAGNIYKGRVSRVLPGMQSAFVDIGLGRDGFLYVSDVLADIEEFSSWMEATDDDQSSNDHRPGRRRSRRARESQRIDALLSKGDEILVQITKAPLGTKGARITTHISLPGRYVVYMPTVDQVGVSRKIGDRAERDRLRKIIHNIRPKNSGGLIVRTAGVGQNQQDFQEDMMFLIEAWKEIKRRSEAATPPTLVHRDLSVLLRLLRDVFTEDFDRVAIDDDKEYQRAVSFLRQLQPAVADRVELYEKDVPIFDQFKVQQQIDKALEAKVWLKSGGYIVINQTEALVAIDINTGKYVGKRRLEDTVLKTNLEAVKEVVRQLRLRDLGGIIVIDFIDMEEKASEQKVLGALLDELKKDRAKTQVLQISEFGLVQLTRQRVKQSLERILLQPCPYCAGRGRVKSVDTICYEILREVKRLRNELNGREVVIRANPVIAEALKNSERALMIQVRSQVDAPVSLLADSHLHQEQFEVVNL